MSGARSAIAATLLNGTSASLKRLAWAYGCAAKGSDEERQLEQLLRERIRSEEQKPCDTGCGHERTTLGANVPRRWGSWRTEVCRDCGAFRTHGHDAERSQLSAWRPASEYAEATAEQEID
jgi:hypothetical protein